MKHHWSILPGCLLAALACQASDHADPIDFGPMLSRAIQENDREAGITDLHVFLDSDQDPSLSGKPTAVVVSFCVGRSLPPLKEKTSTDKDAKTIPTYPPESPGNLLIPRHPLASASTQPGVPAPSRPLSLSPYTYRIFIDTDSPLSFTNRADNDRYGGTILNPTGIAEDITLEVSLSDDIFVRDFRFGGLLHYDQSAAADHVVSNAAVTSANRDKIHIRAGIFDDPFIFPRFFRTNVIGIVIQIPLRHLDLDRQNWLIWGTTWNGKKQIDHVGRSQRTQLPRFDYLNDLHPRMHVAEINRVHERPTIIEDIRRSFISPLFARRHYDAVPDVMIYRRDQPTRFPNGRMLSDDVGGIIAQTGDTQLFELSYADSTEYPRVTMNEGFYKRLPSGELEVADGKPVQLQHKVFRTSFPYLPVPWTMSEVLVHPLPAPSRAVLQNRTLSKLLWLAIGAVAASAGSIGLAWWMGYRTGKFRHHPHVADGFSVPQGMTNEDKAPGSTYAEIHAAVIDPKTSRAYYRVWGAHDETHKELPRYDVSFWTVAKGILPLGIPWSLASATRRTLNSKADLRWGPNRTGFQRLIHPNGICLAGEWLIDDIETGYTGYFKGGSRGRVIARYSPGGSETRRDHGWRSMGLIGKLFPQDDPAGDACRTHASFVVQEDIGGTTSQSINDSVLLNAPDVSAWRRGKGMFSLALSGLIFARVNVNATIRQLHEIAELGEPASGPTRCPTFMRLKVIDGRITEGIGLDVRDEILDHIYDKGDPERKRQLVLSIEVSKAPQDHVKKNILNAWLRRDIPDASWKAIGKLTFTEATCGYNGDFVIHFRHPKWRSEINDRSSTADVR
ncbi:MAG: hypothetical protein ACKV19_00235 [Verrucomicrobiales bacterium]